MAPSRAQHNPGTTQAKKHVTYGLLLLAVFSISLLPQTVNADVPTVVWGMASTFIEGQFMLVHGGSTARSSPPSGQTFTLKLNTTWNASQPDIAQHSIAFPGCNFASALSSDLGSWFMVSNSTIHKLNVSTGGWTDFASSQSLTNKPGLRAATDPRSGMIYVVNGLPTNGSYSLQQYNPTTDKSNAIPMDPRIVSLSEFAVVWSTARGSMLVHGGVSSESREIQQQLYEFVPDEGVGKWTLLSDKGDIPGPRRSHCLVPAYGGSKMILFGGFKQPWLGDRVTSFIHSLDMKTLTWTALTDPGERYARAYHACAVSNDLFVSWGGSDENSNNVSTSNNVTLVYNLKKNVWQDTYSPVLEQADAVPLSPAAISGIVAGSFAIVLTVAFVAYRRKQRLYRTPVSAFSAGSVAKNDTLRSGKTNSANNRKDESQSLEPIGGDGQNTGYHTPLQGAQYGQHYSPQGQSSILPLTEDSLVPAYFGNSYAAPANNVESEQDDDETTYRPNEIIVRSPQAIIDTRGYQDCSSTARGPQSIQF